MEKVNSTLNYYTMHFISTDFIAFLFGLAFFSLSFAPSSCMCLHVFVCAQICTSFSAYAEQFCCIYSCFVFMHTPVYLNACGHIVLVRLFCIYSHSYNLKRKMRRQKKQVMNQHAYREKKKVSVCFSHFHKVNLIFLSLHKMAQEKKIRKDLTNRIKIHWLTKAMP